MRYIKNEVELWPHGSVPDAAEHEGGVLHGHRWKIARALISVTDKTGVVEFARALAEKHGVDDLSTGGTARVLVEAGVPVTPIQDFTGFPEMMECRVKTLHPKVHGGLLARRDSEQHMAEALRSTAIELIDLVCVNLYEFEKTVASPDVTFADAIEHIDIGGLSKLPLRGEERRLRDRGVRPRGRHALVLAE